jgi:hypothetical protein
MDTGVCWSVRRRLDGFIGTGQLSTARDSAGVPFALSPLKWLHGTKAKKASHLCPLLSWPEPTLLVKTVGASYYFLPAVLNVYWKI